MEHKCPDCGNVINEKIGIHYYRGSGLKNLFLENIPVYECACGVSYPSLFRLHRLNQLIGEKLVEKTALLKGEEIRFLRKSVRMSATEFADTLGVDKTTFSKWENNSQSHRDSYDRLIRTTFMALKKMGTTKQIQILDMLKKIRLAEQEVPHVLIAAKIGNDYQIQWKIVAENYVGKGQNIWVTSQDVPGMYTTRTGIAVHESSFFEEHDVVETKAQQNFVGI